MYNLRIINTVKTWQYLMVIPFPREASRTGTVKNPVSIFIPFFWFGVFNREITLRPPTNNQWGRPPSLLFN